MYRCLIRIDTFVSRTEATHRLACVHDFDESAIQARFELTRKDQSKANVDVSEGIPTIDFRSGKEVNWFEPPVKENHR